MNRSPTWLLEHKRDVYSQTGEDGVIEAIFEVIAPGEDPWCVEFGAWDGIHLTNTRHLIESRGFRAVLIEADTARFRELAANYRDNERVTTVNRSVGFTAADGLDAILRETPIPRSFDLLSIDIDGNDYHVWQAVEAYRPRVVVIEFNPTIPTPVRFVQEADPRIKQGCSLLALVELGRKKGYELVCALPFNAVFVTREEYPALGLPTNDPAVLRTHQGHITYLFSGYDGRVFLAGSRKLPWHGLELRESDLQPLPPILRRYPGNYSPLQRRLFELFKRLRRGAPRR